MARPARGDLRPTTPGMLSSPSGEDKADAPLREVMAVQKRTSQTSAFWRSVKLRLPGSLGSVTIRGGPACLITAGLIYASIVRAFDLFTASISFVAASAGEIRIPTVIRKPPPSSQVVEALVDLLNHSILEIFQNSTALPVIREGGGLESEVSVWKAAAGRSRQGGTSEITLMWKAEGQPPVRA